MDGSIRFTRASLRSRINNWLRTQFYQRYRDMQNNNDTPYIPGLNAGVLRRFPIKDTAVSLVSWRSMAIIPEAE